MSQITILHVEDDSNDVLLFRHACEHAGVDLNLQVALDGHEAIAYLNGEEHFANRVRYPVPALVLLDLKMPRVNGFEVLAWIRQEPSLRRVPVVVFSSSRHEADVLRAYDFGANSYLVKPADFCSLIELVKSLDKYWLALNEPAPAPANTKATRSAGSMALSM